MSRRPSRELGSPLTPRQLCILRLPRPQPRCRRERSRAWQGQCHRHARPAAGGRQFRGIHRSECREDFREGLRNERLRAVHDGARARLRRLSRDMSIWISPSARSGYRMCQWDCSIRPRLPLPRPRPGCAERDPRPDHAAKENGAEIRPVEFPNSLEERFCPRPVMPSATCGLIGESPWVGASTTTIAPIFTRLYRSIMSSLVMRMQPEDTAEPIFPAGWCRGCETACPCRSHRDRARARRADYAARAPRNSGISGRGVP